MTEWPSKLPHAPVVVDPKVHRLELLISNLLRLGVAISLTLVVFGMVVSFIHHPTFFYSPPDLDQLTTPHVIPFPHTLAGVLDGLCHFRGQSIILLGLCLLIATPVFRVAVSLVAFLIQRDRRFALITAGVLLLLLLSFLIGKAGA